MNFEQEVYYQASRYIDKQLKSFLRKPKHRGRPTPGAVRPSERLIIPGGLSAYQSLAYFTVALIVLYNYDLELSRILNQFLHQAKLRKYQGCWEIFLEIALKNGVESDSDLINSQIQDNPKEAFAVPEHFEILLGRFSESDIFGNLLPVGCKILFGTWKTKSIFDSESKLPVKKPQRKRGYSDHGTLPEYDSLARKQANRLVNDNEIRLKWDSLNQVHIFQPLTGEE